MAKRSWSGSFQRSLRALTRATVRAGTRAVLKASKQAMKKAAAPSKERRPKPSVQPSVQPSVRPPAGPGTWTTGIALGTAGRRRYRLYKPPGTRAAGRLPLLVMLHGCTQDADSFARSTRLHRLAARAGFFVLCPEQSRGANLRGCWNWFDTRSGRADAEAASIVAAIDQACARHPADPARVAVAGFSAGASMAALLALRHPGRFKAVAMHSGVAPGSAHSTATALSAMQGRRQPPPLPAGIGADLPPLLVIQGTADAIVRPGNGSDAARWWAAATGAKAVAARSLQRGRRHPMTVTAFKRKGRALVSLCEVAGLGHAWSGGAAGEPYSDPKGPDASRLIWAFALRQFRVAASAQPALQSAAKQ